MDDTLMAEVIRQLGDIHEGIAAVKTDVANVKQDVAEVKQDVSEVKSTISNIESRITNIETRMDNLERSSITVSKVWAVIKWSFTTKLGLILWVPLLGIIDTISTRMGGPGIDIWGILGKVIGLFF